VLVADDHADMVKAICRLLALDCDVVGTVSDGGEVLEAVQRLQPDVTVVDLNLPTVSGFEACRSIRQVDPNAKVIVFTAMNDPSLRQRAFELGASAFVCKVATGRRPAGRRPVLVRGRLVRLEVLARRHRPTFDRNML
jgi:DNA-binding NarL/FixJ family response regulator